MTLEKLARMCEVLENQTPTMKVNTIVGAMPSFDDKARLMYILSMEYNINNIGNKRAITWIAESLGLFEDEVESAVHTWGDIGEAVYEIDEGNEKDSDISLNTLIQLLENDCSSMSSNSFTIFKEHLNKMSAREKKWFLRYWLRTPRNGVNNKIPLKAMAKYYGKGIKEVEKYARFNKAHEICVALDNDEEPDCKLVHGQFVKPMLAKAKKETDVISDPIIDIKYDGNRYQIHHSYISEMNAHSTIIFNRKGNVVTNQFPDVVDIVRSMNLPNIILDCEIYPVDMQGNPAEHKLLAKRVHKKNKDEAMQECPVKLAVFDLLSYNANVMLDEPQRNRMTALKEIIEPEYQTYVFPSDTTIESAYRTAIDLGFEGIMIKDPTLPYQSGKRSKGWLKHKPPRFNYDVVITSASYGDGKRSHVYGTYGISVKDGSDYVSVGKVGTGFSDYDLEWLTTELRKNVESFSDDVMHFLPRIVLEVTCDLVTTDSNNNIGLRFPRCIRIRKDKYASEVDTLDTLKEAM